MRFAMKIFAVSYLAVVITFGLGGFAMLEVSFRQGLDSRRETVLAGNEALCVAWHTVAQSAGEGDLTAVFRHQVSGRSAGGERTAIGGVSELTSPALPGGDALLQGLEVGQRASGLLRDGEGWCLAVVSRLSDGADGPMYVETVADFTDLYANRQANYRVYRASLVRRTESLKEVWGKELAEVDGWLLYDPDALAQDKTMQTEALRVAADYWGCEPPEGLWPVLTCGRTEDAVWLDFGGAADLERLSRGF